MTGQKDITPNANRSVDEQTAVGQSPQLSTREVISPYLSQKFKLLSFVAMLCVVFIHAYNYTDTFLQPTTTIAEGLHVGAMVQFFLSNAATRFATPLFFFISGYLFFAAFRRFTFSGYLRKLGKRTCTLLVPYILWVGLWTGIATLLVWAVGFEFFPILGDKLGGLYNGEWWQVFTNPVPFQAWYILDLFKLVIVSPIIFVAVRYLRWGAVILAAVPWVMDYSIPYFVNCDGLLFFTLGAYLAVRAVAFPGRNKPMRRNWLFYATPCVWIALCVTYTVLSAMGKQLNLHWAVLMTLYKLCVLSGFCSIFVLYDLIGDRVKNSKFVNVLASGTFMLYITHEPLQHMAFQTVLRYTQADWAHMLCYFGLPVALVAFGVGLSVGIRKLSPKLHAFLTGGR